jgi:DNA repair protein RadC
MLLVDDPNPCSDAMQQLRMDLLSPASPERCERRSHRPGNLFDHTPAATRPATARSSPRSAAPSSGRAAPRWRAVSCTAPADAVSAFRELFEGREREVFAALLLDARHRIIGVHVVRIGSLTESLAHPREVFRAGIVAGAAAVIFGHNHPSGDTTPFPEDVATTRRLIEAGTLLGINVLDHVICSETGWHSLKLCGHGRLGASARLAR